ncbi:DUF5309 domain-containing protein [Planctomycetota bacterium]|nr:DUF5309 domain-containing protein [Planctomycetota bacterium]
MSTTLGVRGTGGPAGPARGTGKDVSQREDLANFITMITRDETPFMSSIGSTKATAIYHEWQTDTLEAPGSSRIAEGQDYLEPASGGATATPAVGAKFAESGPTRTRLGNYTQINGKTIAVSGTRRAVDQAGIADEYAYQLKKRGTELRRDVEFDLVHSMNASAAVGTQGNTARSMGGYQAFINSAATVDYVGEFEAPSAATTGAGTDADGTAIPRSSINGSTTAPDRDPLALANIDSVMQKIYEEGGKATKIMLSPKLRRDFSDLMVGDSGVRRNIDADGKLRQSVDVYMSDFGDIMVVPNYIMGLSNNFAFTGDNNVAHSGAGVTDLANFSALIYDPMWFNMATLRPLAEVDVGQKGDSTVGMMVEETTLEVRNPVGCGAIYGLE